jgi:exosortase C (VPDSG-CTERM-specific)
MASPQNEVVSISQRRDDLPVEKYSLRSSRFARWRVYGFALFFLILALCFSIPLLDLAQFAIRSDLYSHILLIPFVSLYFLCRRRHQLVLNSRPSASLALPPLTAGCTILILSILPSALSEMQPQDYLALMTFAALSFLWGGLLLFYGTATLRAAAFPLLLLVFIVPFPLSLQHRIESVLQLTSAMAASLFFQISGTPVLQEGTIFHLPGFSLKVARECSGIHSSLVLFVTGLVMAQFLLTGFWKKLLLVLFVLPLSIVRNGIRIFIIGELCLHVGPQMIHSFIHTYGGPIFFVISLVPLFLLLRILMKWSEKNSFSR